MKQTYAMVDNINMGTTLDDPTFESTGVECSKEESLNIKRIMLACGAEENKDGITLLMHPGSKHKKLGSTITVSMRMDKRKGSSWFLNVHANPTSAFTGDNTFGNLRLKTGVQRIFYYVLDYLANKGANTKRLIEEVRRGNIHIQSVTFALYSSRLKNVKIMRQMIDRWYFMYETRVRIENKFTSLLQELAIKRAVGDQYEDSISLSIYGLNDKQCKGNKLMHLCLYNKIEEKKVNDRPIKSEEEEDDLSRRIRFDLTVSNYCLKNRWSINRPTLRSLYEEVKSRYGDWRLAVEDLMQYAINRTCLLYMMNVPNPFLNEYKKELELWSEGKLGKKWDPLLIDWAKKLNLNLNVSPEAHLIMLQGQLGLLMNRSELLRDGLSSNEGSLRYLKHAMKSLTATRESLTLSKAASSLALDFSKPDYVE